MQTHNGPQIKAGETYIIKSDSWFPAPDGESYTEVWGKVYIKSAEEVLGLKPNMRSANWYAIVGTEENHVVIAGCQIHSACFAPKPPLNKTQKCWSMENGVLLVGVKPSSLYIADGPIEQLPVNYPDDWVSELKTKIGQLPLMLDKYMKNKKEEAGVE